MKRQLGQRKPSLLDPNVPISGRNHPSQSQETQPKRRKQIESSERTVQPYDAGSLKRLQIGFPSIVSRKPTTFAFDEWALTPNYITDILEAETRLETRVRLSKSFCNNPLFCVTPYHREVAVEWLVDMQMSLKTGNDALHLAVTLMDLVLDSQRISEDEIQAVAAAAMWLAYKFFYGGIKAKLILKFCKITLPELIRNERKILQVTKMNLIFTNPVTIINWHLYCKFGKEIPLIEYHMSNYLMEIMLLVAEFAVESVVKRASVAVETAFQLLESRANMKSYINSSSPSGLIIHKRLLSTLRAVWDRPGFRDKSSLFRKYRSMQYQCVSTHPSLNPNLFDG